jgi:hypothetical protein
MAPAPPQPSVRCAPIYKYIGQHCSRESDYLLLVTLEVCFGLAQLNHSSRQESKVTKLTTVDFFLFIHTLYFGPQCNLFIISLSFSLRVSAIYGHRQVCVFAKTLSLRSICNFTCHMWMCYLPLKINVLYQKSLSLIKISIFLLGGCHPFIQLSLYLYLFCSGMIVVYM